VTTYLARLSHRGALEFEGPDSRQFLQGQTTCDLEQLSAERSLVGAFCNPQGRMVCDFRLLQQDSERLLMVLERDCLEIARDTFAKYIVFSKAELREADAWCHYALWGEDAAALAGADQSAAHSSWQKDGQLWVASEIPDTFELCLPAQQADNFEASLTDVVQVDSEAFRLLEIRAGIGHVSGAISGVFLPQMLNFQAIDRISFSKGCYTGQEVVARMHYRGQVKRPMALASATADAEVNPGDSVHAAGAEQTVGQVVNAARDGDGQLWLLASVTREARESGAELGGSLLEFHSLPYALEST
jgi:folate-binding protein YgfZ